MSQTLKKIIGEYNYKKTVKTETVKTEKEFKDTVIWIGWGVDSERCATRIHQ